jgi:hypothetical protein
VIVNIALIRTNKAFAFHMTMHVARAYELKALQSRNIKGALS